MRQVKINLSRADGPRNNLSRFPRPTDGYFHYIPAIPALTQETLRREDLSGSLSCLHTIGSNHTVPLLYRLYVLISGRFLYLVSPDSYLAAPQPCPTGKNHGVSKHPIPNTLILRPREGERKPCLRTLFPFIAARISRSGKPLIQKRLRSSPKELKRKDTRNYSWKGT